MNPPFTGSNILIDINYIEFQKGEWTPRRHICLYDFCLWQHLDHLPTIQKQNQKEELLISLLWSTDPSGAPPSRECSRTSIDGFPFREHTSIDDWRDLVRHGIDPANQ